MAGIRRWPVSRRGRAQRQHSSGQQFIGLVAAGAVAALAILPPEHVHLAADGRHSVVHRHLFAYVPPGPTLTAHAATDHSHAVFLDPAFNVHSSISLEVAILPSAVARLGLLKQVNRNPAVYQSIRINGPPGRSSSPRAPPPA